MMTDSEDIHTESFSQRDNSLLQEFSISAAETNRDGTSKSVQTTKLQECDGDRKLLSEKQSLQ